MSRFNQTTSPTKTENLAGGEAYTQSRELELLSILLTSFANDQFYRSSDDTFFRLKELISSNNIEFAAKAIVFARTEFGMRSISHVAASEIAKYASGKPWAKRFFDRVIYRPDDMTEIISYHKNVNGKLTNAMKSGFAQAFDKFDAYQLAKYRGEGKGVKLVDVVNMVHPVPVESNAQALDDLVNGKLRSFNTWENELSDAGSSSEKKKNVWVKLISERKIGYFALLRNLRNILDQAPEMIDAACEMITDEKLIKKSLVLPFRYLTALSQLESRNDAMPVIVALNKAVDISCNNVPKFEGSNLVVCDYSGSMGSGYNSYKYKASLFASVFARTNHSDFMIFGDDSEYLSYNPNDSILTMTKQFISNNNHFHSGGNGVYVGHGTNFKSIFEKANKAYDRIIIFSDMQGWIGYHSPQSRFHNYKKSFNVNPKVYSFDLAGYGTLQFPENDVYTLAGFSEKVFDIMKFMDEDKKELIKRINSIEL